MDGTILAGGFLLAKLATIEPTASIISQPTVFFGYCLQPKMVSAIQFYHLADCRFLSFYSAHLSCFRTCKAFLLSNVGRQSSLYYLIDVGKIAAFLVVVETVTNDEIILNVKATVINVKADLQTTGLYKEGGNAHIFGLFFIQNA